MVEHERSQPGNDQGDYEAADHGHGPDRRCLDVDAINQSTAGEAKANRKAYGILSEQNSKYQANDVASCAAVTVCHFEEEHTDEMREYHTVGHV